MLLHVATSLSCLCFSPWFQRKICGPDGGDMVSVVKSLTERYAKYLLFFIISSEMTGAQESLPHISRDNDLSANECVSFLSRHSALNKKYVTRVCESIEELLQKRCRYYMWNHMNLSILYVLSWAKWAVWFSSCFTRTYLEWRMMCGSACTDKFHIQTTRSCFTGQLIRTLCFLLPLPSFSSHSLSFSPLPPLPLSPSAQSVHGICVQPLFGTLSDYSELSRVTRQPSHHCFMISIMHATSLLYHMILTLGHVTSSITNIHTMSHPVHNVCMFIYYIF